MTTDALREFEQAVRRIEEQTGHRPYKALVSHLVQRAFEQEVQEGTEGRAARTSISRLGGVPLDLEEKLPEGEVRFLLEEQAPIQVRLVNEDELGS